MFFLDTLIIMVEVYLLALIVPTGRHSQEYTPSYLGRYMMVRCNNWGDIWWWDIISGEIYDEIWRWKGGNTWTQYCTPWTPQRDTWLIDNPPFNIWTFDQSQSAPAGAGWRVPLLVVLNQALAPTTLVPAPVSGFISSLLQRLTGSTNNQICCISEGVT